MEEDEEEAAAAEVDEEDEVAWASLGGVGCCGSGCCCGGCCWGDWATPEPRWPLPPPAPPGPPPAPPRSAMAWPGVEGAQGLRRLRPRRVARRLPSAVAAAGAQRDSDRPAEREPPANLHARAGLRCARSSRSPAAACCGPRGPDTGWACPKGAGSRGPTQPGAKGRGQPSWAPRPLGRGLQSERSRGAALRLWSACSALLLPLRWPLPRQRKPGFSGARSRTGEGCTGARSAPGICRARSGGQRSAGHALRENRIACCATPSVGYWILCPLL